MPGESFSIRFRDSGMFELSAIEQTLNWSLGNSDICLTRIYGGIRAASW